MKCPTCGSDLIEVGNLLLCEKCGYLEEIRPLLDGDLFPISQYFYFHQQYDKMMIYLLDGKEKGIPECEYLMGLCYLNGRGVNKSKLKAFTLFEKAAAKGYPEAINSLGMCYQYGKGCKVDFNLAIENYQKAALLDNVNAKVNLGQCYLFGYGTKIDLKKAYDCFSLKEVQNSITALYNEAMFHFKGIVVEKNIDKAISFLEKATRLGSIEALTMLGNIYLSDETKDVSLALACYEEALEKYHYIPAGDILGEIYFHGIRIKKDYLKAFKYYLDASNHNFLNAHYHVGRCYLTGLGVNKDIVEAYRYFLKAAEYGQVDSLLTLGVMHLGEYEDYGIKKDVNIAIRYFKIAGEKGSLLGKYNLARAYLNNLDQQENYHQAITLINECISKNFLKVYTLLGIAYQKGLGVEKDINRAEECFLKGDEIRDAESDYYLAYIYLNKDKDKANHYFSKARMLGYHVTEEEIELFER